MGHLRLSLACLALLLAAASAADITSVASTVEDLNQVFSVVGAPLADVKENCEDPDAHRTFQEIVAVNGYPLEAHEVFTEDGYILTLYRIPGPRNTSPAQYPKGQPVLLQHGLLDCSNTWFINIREESLAFILADQGFDVWMGNNRGNTYSMRHRSLDPNKPEFWKISWDQMGRFDVPANLDYIRNKTHYDKVVYVGHSQGTTQMFAALSLNPSLQDKLAGFVGLGPVIRVTSENNALVRFMAAIHVDWIIEKLGTMSLLHSGPFFRKVGVRFCGLLPSLCKEVVQGICGFNRGAFNNSRMAVMANLEPGGASVQNLAHWAQMIRTGDFRMYDYGKEGNMAHYGSAEAPLFDISRLGSLSLPMHMFSGANDLLADPTDVQWLVDSVLPKHTVHTVLPDYAHLDFAWATDAFTRIYPAIISFAKEHAGTRRQEAEAPLYI